MAEILTQIINVLFEDRDVKNLSWYGIVDNSVIKNNIHKLHKQVFMKDKVEVVDFVPAVQGKARGLSKKGFESIVTHRKNVRESQRAQNTKSVRVDLNTKKTQTHSLLADMLQEQDPSDFVIQPPEKHRSFYLESKIYFFNTPVHLTIKISTKNLTIDVIRHIMTVYKHSTFAQTKPLKYPNEPERYQLWLIDEYESAYAPDEEMGARPMNSEIG